MSWYDRVVDELPAIDWRLRANDILRGKAISIVGVPSPRAKNTDHWVVCQEGVLYDPSPHNDFKHIDQASDFPIAACIGTILLEPLRVIK